MGLASKWALPTDAGTKQEPASAASETKPSRKTNGSASSGSKSSSSEDTRGTAAKKKSSGGLESKWAKSEPEAPTVETAPQKSPSKSRHQRSRDAAKKNGKNPLASRLNIESETVAEELPKAATKSSKAKPLAEPHAEQKVSKHANTTQRGQAQESESDGEEDVRKDLGDLSLGAQSLASRLGLMSAPPTGPKQQQRKKTPDSNSKQKKDKVSTKKARASKAHSKESPAAPAPEPKPTIDFDKMFNNFVNSESQNWADEDDDWDISQFK